MKKKYIIIISGLIFSFALCFVFLGNMKQTHTLMERYDLTEEEALIIEQTISAVEDEIKAKTGKDVELDISDLTWIEDPKEYAQLVMKLKNKQEYIQSEVTKAIKEELDSLKSNIK